MRARVAMFATLATLTLLLTPLAVADGTVHTTWEDAAGTRYYLSTGTSSGLCLIWEEGEAYASCFSQTGHASASAAGCGEVSKLGSCIVTTSIDDPTPTGTTSIKCADGKIYTVSDGGSGECPPVDLTAGGGTISCTQPGQSNYASATCDRGCGAVSGTGSCTVR